MMASPWREMKATQSLTQVVGQESLFNLNVHTKCLGPRDCTIMQILAVGLGQAGEPAFLTSSREAAWTTSILTGHHLRSHLPTSASFPFMGDL